MKAPTNTPQWYWYESWDQAVEEYAQQHGLRYYNFLNDVDEIGIDYTTDTYDAGLHLNMDGAVKMSGFFARILAEDHGMEDHRDDPDIDRIYDEKLRLYDLAANAESE